jgi:hypothetical protein
MANEMRSLSDVEIDAVAGGYLEDVLISSWVVGPTVATDGKGQSASRERE